MSDPKLRSLSGAQASNQTENPELSVQATLTCWPKDSGCGGGRNGYA